MSRIEWRSDKLATDFIESVRYSQNNPLVIFVSNEWVGYVKTPSKCEERAIGVALQI